VHGYLDLARLLIDHGADVIDLDSSGVRYGYLVAMTTAPRCTEDGWTALHLASSEGHLDIAKLLIDRGANVDSRNDEQETPLALASSFGHLDIARFLIESGAAVSAPDKEGNTPFHMAANKGHLDVTKFLLECGIDVDIRNGDGETSLYLASGTGSSMLYAS
jgi:ankyrin repeat protein